MKKSVYCAMRKIALSCMMGTIIFPLKADIIVKKDGTQLNVFNVEESGKWILYTEQVSIDSDLRRISIDEVFGIKQDDGEMRMVGTSYTPTPQPKQEASAGPRKIEATPAPDNQNIINRYNTSTFASVRKEPNKKKYCKGSVTSIWGISDNSIMKDGNVEISFLYLGALPTKNKKGGSLLVGGNVEYTFIGYGLAIENKSNETVYVDLTNSFKIFDGQSVPYFDGKTFTTSHGSSSGGSVGLGGVASAIGIGGAIGSLASGITLGGGSSSNLQVTEAAQPVISIPPGGKVRLPLVKKVYGKEIREVPDEYSVGGYDKSGEELRLYDWDFVEITDAPAKYRYLISYSTTPDFSTYYQLPVELYLRGIFGHSYYESSLGKYNIELGDDMIVGDVDVIKGNKNKCQATKDEKRRLKEALKQK